MWKLLLVKVGPSMESNIAMFDPIVRCNGRGFLSKEICVWSNTRGFVGIVTKFREEAKKRGKLQTTHKAWKRRKENIPATDCGKVFAQLAKGFDSKYNFQGQFWGQKSAPGCGCGCVHFSTLHCSQSIQLENDDSTDKQCQDSSIEFHTNQNFDLGHNWAKRREVRVEGIFGIWWAAATRMAFIRIFLAQNYRPSDHFHDWDSRASDLTKTLGLNQSLKNTILESAILYCSGQIREFESAAV